MHKRDAIQIFVRHEWVAEFWQRLQDPGLTTVNVLTSVSVNPFTNGQLQTQTWRPPSGGQANVAIHRAALNSWQILLNKHNYKEANIGPPCYINPAKILWCMKMYIFQWHCMYRPTRQQVCSCVRVCVCVCVCVSWLGVLLQQLLTCRNVTHDFNLVALRSREAGNIAKTRGRICG